MQSASRDRRSLRLTLTETGNTEPRVLPDFFDPRGEIRKTSHNLPHWQQGEAWIFVTWRLADSMPAEKLRAWASEQEAWLRHNPKPWDEATQAEHQKRFIEPFESWLDRGSGACLLRDPENLRIVVDALLHFDRSRYQLGAFVVMPNHVHVLFCPPWRSHLVGNLAIMETPLGQTPQSA